MMNIAIIGSGPTAIYTASALIREARGPLKITVFESQGEAGKGMPYHPQWNDGAMLSNIASIEIPPVTETLVQWLERQSDATLNHLRIDRASIDERAFFPRVVLGEYFHAQLDALVERAAAEGVTLTIRTRHKVMDVTVLDDGIRLAIENAEGALIYPVFSHAVMATGHAWSPDPETRPGYFLSPWPATALRSIGQCHVGIRGTSLSAIDATVALATARGSFLRDEAGTLRYLPEPGTEDFRVTLMSRKGILPEADFYHPIPYEPLRCCTEPVMDALIASGRPDLLDAAFALFKEELRASDPIYYRSTGLADASLEQFCDAYFCARESEDPFRWAERNLAEAKANLARRHTVPWRYAILRTHEVIGRVVPHLSAQDHRRFNAHFKKIFVDDYATVPHESIERVLALRAAGKLDILRLGPHYTIDTHCAQGGAVLTRAEGSVHFPAFIEATGQRELSAREFPFPSLRRQNVIRNASAVFRVDVPGEPSEEREVDIGGVALDAAFHPVSDRPYASRLYCLSLPFMLSQFPFAQGITSSHGMGGIVARDICKTAGAHATVPAPGELPALAAGTQAA